MKLLRWQSEVDAMDKFILLYRDRQLTELLDWLESLGFTGEISIFILTLAANGGEV
jgi:hypothetical protein